MAGGGQSQSRGNGRNILIGLAVLLVVGALLVVVVRAVLSLLASADPTVLAAVVVTSGTFLVSAGSLILSNRFQARQQAQQAQRDKKAEAYEELLTYWFWVMRERSDATPAQKKRTDEKYRATVPQKLITWGSEDVIKEFTAQVGPSGVTEETSMLGFERLLLAVRRDLGHTNKGLEDGDLLRPFLTGVDEAVREEQEGV